MRFFVVTLFPELFDPFLSKGLLGKAQQAGVVVVRCENPRDHSENKHNTVDDAPYGGGSGMVMAPGPVLGALGACEREGRTHRVLLSPSGRPFDQSVAQRFSKLSALTLICGRYEGVDERVADDVDEVISLGDFVMMGGEVAAMAIVEATARLVPNVLGNLASTEEESHAAGRLEYPQYTRPPEFAGRSVPQVLLSGDHAAVARYRRKESLRRTRDRRPDLFARLALDVSDQELLVELTAESSQPRGAIYLGLVHHPVKDRSGQTVTTAVTNLDVHDLSRSARTYGLRGYFVITPISVQRELVDAILQHWVDGSGRKRVPERGAALEVCRPVESIAAAVDAITQTHGVAPRVAVTAAKAPESGRVCAAGPLGQEMRADDRPWLLLFGTGHGLSAEVLEAADRQLAPIRPGVYNHLSVRAACAITLDRLFGDAGG